MIRSRTLKLIFLLTTFIIAAIIALQLYWLNNTYNYEQKEFTANTYKCLQSIYKQLELGHEKAIHLQKLIEKPNDNTFLLKIDCTPPREELVKNVISNLEDFGIFTDCKLAAYDYTKQQNVYNEYLPTIASQYPKQSQYELVVYAKNYDYVQFYFPHRNAFVLTQLKWWIFSSILLIVILIAFGVTIFSLYKQKFLNEEQTDFINNVTHEFQTPLTTLSLGLENIKKPSIQQQPQKFSKYIDLMEGQVQYLKQHISNLTNVAKADVKGIVLVKENIDPNTIIETALLQLSGIIEETKATINLNLTTHNTKVLADENTLVVAIINIISNAIKYATLPVIHITTNEFNKYYNITITDNGIGISKDDLKKVFKKFYRVHVGNIHTVKGLGLGLYFVNKVIKAHKGKINITSEPNIGTTVHIQLLIK